VNIHSSNIRRPQLSELSELASLDREIFGDLAYNLLTLRQFYDLAGSLLVVAAADNRLVGYALVLPSAVRREGWFMALGVRASHRRRSLGRSLSKTVLYEAKCAGMTSVRLTVEGGNGAARNLYSDLGFISEGNESDYFGPGQDRIVMRNAAI
jgi:[ribosomal protein S18]-alanine N-acetyltransferase